jgi:hypothetical protein
MSWFDWISAFALDGAQRHQPEAHLEQRHGDEADAGQRQRCCQLGAELGDALLRPFDRTCDHHRVPPAVDLVAEPLDQLGDAQPLAARTGGVAPADVLGGRRDLAEKRRLQLLGAE